MEEQAAALLQRYRRDRRKLLEFLLSSSGLVKELRTPSGSTASSSLSSVDLDPLSADYILQCLKSGGVVDVAEARRKYSHESALPVVIESQVGSSYFLVSDLDSAGSPPRRNPPAKHVNQTAKQSHSANQMGQSHVENITFFGDNNGLRCEAELSAPMRPLGNSEALSIGLPSLNTGLLDDDLRESAYELLLASVLLSEIEVHPVEERKKEKSSKFLSGLKSRRDKRHSESQLIGRYSELMDIVRVQMEISVAMDACVRRNLAQLAARRNCGQIDLPQISLGLLNGVFKSDFSNEKSYMKWKNRQANMLEELLCFCPIDKTMTNERVTIRSYLAKIRDVKEWDNIMSPSERVAILASIRQVAMKFSSLLGQFGLQGETFYWTAGYHLNIRLYQKLLFAVFDCLDEGQLIEELDEVLSLLRLTWSTLGITQKMHNALYASVLIQQFAGTGEHVLLESAIHELQKVLSVEEDDGNERNYISSLGCAIQFDNREMKLNVVQAIFSSISIWCDNKLQDYHLHFIQKPSNFGVMMTLVSAIGILTIDDHGRTKLTKLDASNDNTSRKLKSYVTRSTRAACVRVASKIDIESNVQRTHPLALLAHELKLIAERESTVFSTILCQWYPESLVISTVLLHQFYGERLKPFLMEVSSLSEDVRAVLPAADTLDHYLIQLYTSSVESNSLHHYFNQDLDHYRIGDVCKPLVLDWVLSQHSHILEWTGRAFDIEDWEPLSFNQRQAASIVEVFRIIEETVDQFFGMNLPMDITHLQALLSVIFHSLDGYLQKMLDQLVEKNHLYPSAPPLTRYTETVIPVIRKKLVQCVLLENNVRYKLNQLTVPKLCIRLNTLEYVRKQLGMLEDGIRESWALVRPSCEQKWTKEGPLDERSTTCSEAVDALFATTLSIIKDIATDAINRISDFTGARVVFWDLRESFLLHVYHGDVASSRLESFLPHIDSVLKHICGLIDDNLRDLVVLNICRASLEGYVWVLLDGGPSRAFSDSDVMMMEDDFNTLKEFFVADGEGLPRSLVEQEAKFAKQIVSLFSLQTETIIRMLLDASEHISMGLDSRKHGQMCLEDAHTLVRVLCHKKDREASKFLKRQYQLPMSSEYDDRPSGDSTLGSPLMSDLIKRSTSFRWTSNGHGSFRSIKKKIQEATSEMGSMTR